MAIHKYKFRNFLYHYICKFRINLISQYFPPSWEIWVFLTCLPTLLEAVFNHIWKIVLVFWPLIHFVFCRGGHLGLAVFCGVSHLLKMVWLPIDVYFWSASQFRDGMFSPWHLLHICSFFPNCIVKPFISFTPSVSGTTLSPIRLLYIHMYLLYKCTPCVYFFMLCLLYM